MGSFLAKEIEPLLREYRLLKSTGDILIALVGKESHPIAMMHRLLIYRSFNVVRYDTIADARYAMERLCCIVCMDSCEDADEVLEGEEKGIAYTNNPEEPSLLKKGYCAVIPFPFDPYRCLDTIRSIFDREKDVRKKPS